MSTVYESWAETGFAWEQYNPDTGKGQRTQYFTGWTALIVKILAMPDLEEKSSPQLPDKSIQPNMTDSWNRTLVLIVVAMLLLCFIFRRRLSRIWGRFMEA